MKSSIQTITPATAAARSPQTSPAQPPQMELLTQVEMAQRLGITRRTLHTWVLSGTVPMIKIRGFCRFEPSKVLAALQRHELPADSPKSSSASDSSSSSREGGMSAAAASTAEKRSA